MANNKNFIAKNGVSTGDGYAMPDVRPSLLLDFANSKTLDPRITFTRGSTATYWDGHTTTKAEENLIPYSDFSSGWTDEGSTTITLNSDTAPDGTTTADKLFGVNGETKEYKYVSLAISNSGKLTGSVYLKEAGQKYAYVQLIAGTTSVRQSVLFDLNTGTQVDTATQGSPTGVSYSITSVGNDWYRCVVTMDQSSSSSGYLLIGMAQSASPAWTSAAVAPVTGTTSDSIIVWGPQLEERDSATAYTATTSQPIVKYQPTLQTAASGEARFDHDPVTGESKGLLIEESRTNTVNYSADFSVADWTKGSVSIEADNIVAPDGSLYNDNTIRENSSNAEHLIYNGNTTVGTSDTFTMSVFAKNGAISPRRYIGLRNNSATSGAMAVFDLQEGTVTDTNASGNYSVVSTSIEDVGNGWYRCSVVMSDGGDGYRPVRVQMVNSATPTYNSISSVTYTGDGVSTLIAWGAQMEINAFPTSYIPTSGSTVTRSVDVCEVGNVSSWYSADRGTMYAEYTQFGNGSLGTSGIWEIYDTSSGTSGWDLRNTSTESILYAQATNGNQTVILSGAGTGGLNVEHRAVVSWSTSGIRVATEYDATSVTSGANSTFAAYEMEIGRHDRNSARVLNGHFKKVSYTPAEYNESTVRAMLEA